MVTPSNYLPLKFEDTEIIRKFEGFSLKAYPDPATGGEPYTIAWGLTGDWVKKDTEITMEVAITKYNEYIQRFSSKFDSLLKVKLNKNEYIAVLSLMWNIGGDALAKSTLLRLLNEGKNLEAAEQFIRWNKANGKTMDGLTKRRLLEKALFLKV